MNRDGNTPLIYASYHGHTELIALLLYYGAEVTVINSNQETAFDVAKTAEIRETIRTHTMLYAVKNGMPKYMCFVYSCFPIFLCSF